MSNQPIIQFFAHTKI